MKKTYKKIRPGFFVVLMVIFLIGCFRSSKKEVEFKLEWQSEHQESYITQKGLLSLYSYDRTNPRSYYNVFYPMQDPSYSLTMDNFLSAPYDTGFTVGGIPGWVRIEFMDRYGKPVPESSHIVLPIELTYDPIFGLNFSHNGRLVSQPMGPDFDQETFHRWLFGAVHIVGYRILPQNDDDE